MRYLLKPNILGLKNNLTVQMLLTQSNKLRANLLEAVCDSGESPGVKPWSPSPVSPLTCDPNVAFDL